MSVKKGNRGYRRIPGLAGKLIVLGATATLSAALIACDKRPERINQVIADFDNRGGPDLVYVSYDKNSQLRTKGHLTSFDAYISLGQTGGGFSAPKRVFHFELKPLYLVAGDQNRDGMQDLLFVAYDADAEPKTKGHDVSFDQYVALGNGDGTFQSPRKILHFDRKPDFLK